MKKLLFSASALLVLAGCGDIPSCDDSDVTDVVSQIYKDELSKLVGAKKAKEIVSSWKYSGFSTNETDEKSKTVYCHTTVTGKDLNGNKHEEIVNYSAKYSDDKSMVYVEVFDE